MAEGITGQSLAGLLDLDVRSIQQLAQAGIMVRSGVRGRYLLAPSVHNYVRHLREIATGRQGNELNAVDENARLKMAQRRNYDLKNAILERNSVPYEAIAPAWARVVRAIRSSMMAVPGKARFRLQHLTPRDAEVIGEIIRDQLEAAALTDQPPAIRQGSYAIAQHGVPRHPWPSRGAANPANR
jgi:phage terminase Nu1 subunit (DNA packaging protein)